MRGLRRGTLRRRLLSARPPEMGSPAGRGRAEGARGPFLPPAGRDGRRNPVSVEPRPALAPRDGYLHLFSK